MSGRDPTAVERLGALSDEELGAQLAGLGQAIAWPSAAPLRGRVIERLEPRPGRWIVLGRPFRRALVLAVIALLVVAGIAAALGLGLPGIRIFFGPAPTATPGASASAQTSASPSATGGAALNLGRRLTLEQARAAVDFPIVQPSLAGFAGPDEIWLEGDGRSAIVSFVWLANGRAAAPGTNVGMLLSEFRGSVDPRLFSKFIRAGTTLEQVTVDGQTAYWITGAPHEVIVRAPGEDPRADQVRLAGNVLLWTRGPLTLRLETTAARDEALRIAASVR